MFCRVYKKAATTTTERKSWQCQAAIFNFKCARRGCRGVGRLGTCEEQLAVRLPLALAEWLFSEIQISDS